MLRVCCIVFALVALVVSPVAADYLIIKVDLEQFNYSSLMNKKVTFVGQDPGVIGGGQPMIPGSAPPGGSPEVQPMAPEAQPMGTEVPPMAGGLVPIKPKDPKADPEDDKMPSYWVYANFDLKKLKEPKVFDVDKIKIIAVDHEWGEKGCIPVFHNVVAELLEHEPLSIAFYRKRKKEGEDNPNTILRQARWALTHGLTKQFHSSMETLQEKAPKRRAVLNYLNVKKQLQTAPKTDDPLTVPLLNDLTNEGFRTMTSAGGHFIVYYPNTQSPQMRVSELRRRLERMEETLERFYYWFALQEGASIPPLPKNRLVVQLVDRSTEFWKRYQEWENPPQVADGFFLRAYNLAVMSAERTDPKYQTLERNMESVRLSLGLTRDDLLKGRVWERAQLLKSPQDVQAVATVQMLTILQKVMQEDSERVTIDHLCTRQILGATGLMPRRVAAPQWIQRGLASFFETPPGSLYTNVCGPNLEYFIQFKELRKKRKFGKSTDVLQNMLTDFYFQEANAAKQQLRELRDNDVNFKAREKLSKKYDENIALAESTSWAFIYYLALTHKMHHLIDYCNELDKLPRDLALTDSALQACFARAFNLTSASDSTKMDPAKLRSFADAWFQEMESVAFEISQLESFHHRMPDRKAPPPTATNNPMGPMGGGAATP